ncbi:MAG: hypothetical protein JW908_07145 [Anaerolineales bacterium]|nr:hypothetical protein [Anaerolineales bacterium]
MPKQRSILWIICGVCAMVILGLINQNPASGTNLPAAPTPQPEYSPQVYQIAAELGIEPFLVYDILSSGIPADEIDQDLITEWPAHLALLAERQQQRLQNRESELLDIELIESKTDAPNPQPVSKEELLWQAIEAAHGQGDLETLLSLAKQLPESPDRQRLLDEFSGEQASSSATPQATNFIGINGSMCAYDTWAAALAAANDGDTLYIDQGTWSGRIGQVTTNLTLQAATNNCQTPASGGVVIDANDASVTFGGVIDILNSAYITLTNLILTDGSANYGGIIYADNNTQVILDNTDLTYGSASSQGGCFRINGGTVTLINYSEITDCETTGSGYGGGVSIASNGYLNLYDDSKVGNYLHGNTSATMGGGIYMNSGTLSMYDDSRVRSNTAATDGGGIYAVNSATIAMFDDTYVGWYLSTANNSAVDGAGVYLAGNNVEMNMEDNAKVQYNTASNYGGGIFADTDSHLMLDGASVLNNTASGRGGGIYTNGAVTAQIGNHSLLSENEVTDSSGLGGGMYIFGDNAYITVTNSSIVTNTANFYFGGVRLYGNSTLTLEEGSDLSYNDATTNGGGGLGLSDGVVNIDSSKVSYNTTPINGGGLYLINGTLNIIDSEVTHNTATQDGGGIYNLGGVINITCLDDSGQVSYNTATNGDGGGIYDNSGNTLTIYESGPHGCYVSSNNAGADGGGIYLNASSLNSQGTVIYVNNTAYDNGGAVYLDHHAEAVFDDTDAFLEVSSLYRNRASHGNGGAIFAANSSQVDLLGAQVGRLDGNISGIGSGGGIYVESSTLNLYNAKILNNEAKLNGGGIAAYTSTVTVQSVYENLPIARLNGVPPVVSPCDAMSKSANRYCSEINNNTAEGDGGGAYLYNSTSIITNTVFFTNTAEVGAAVRVYLGSLDLYNSLISANDAIDSYNPSIVNAYAGTDPANSATLNAIHNTIADNLGNGIYFAKYTGGDLYNNIIWGNDKCGAINDSVTASCNDTQGSAFSGTGNISSDPLFVTTARGDYRLPFYSPAISRCALHGLANDLDGQPRPWGTAYDMGAFEAFVSYLPLVIR